MLRALPPRRPARRPAGAPGLKRGSELRRHLLPLAPALLLLLQGGVQLTLVARADLSRWLGGGFGMFSTIDARSLRALRLGDAEPTSLTLPPDLEDAGERACMLPSEARLRELGLALAVSPLAGGAAVRIEAWEQRFDARMQPAPKLLRAVQVPGVPKHP